MANYRRSLTTSARLFARHRFPPSFSYVHHDDDRRNPHSDEKVKSFLQSRSYGYFGSNNTNTNSLGIGSFRDPRCSQFLHVPMTITSRFLLSAKNISTTNSDAAETEKTEDTMADVVADKAMEIISSDQAPIINEFAIATADSWLPVGFLQIVIFGIHDLTGLNWWATIAITTLLIRASLVPFQINQLKASSKSIILWQQVQQITKEQENNKGMSATEEAEYRERLTRISKEHDVSQFAPLKSSMFIQGPVLVSFFLAIQKMVEKVPSFESGGISWFIDLTTADSFYILPFLAAFSCLLNLESNRQEGDPNAAGKMKNISRGLAVLTLPLTASFPNALFFYWIPSNFFSTVFGLIMKKPSVKKLLNIPIIVPPPPPPASPTSESKPAAFSFFEDVKKYAAAQAVMQQIQAETKPTITNQTTTSLLSQKLFSDQHKLTSQRVSSSSVFNHRIKKLEKKLKGRKKNKKR